MKTRKCREKKRGCKVEFEPWTGNIMRQGVCKNPLCLFSKAEKNRKKREKKERAKKREKKNGAKTVKEILAEAQYYCNKHVRQSSDVKVCYTCGQHKEKLFAGHFIPVGTGANWAIRFHHDNIRPQCFRCNNHEGGRPGEYEIRLRQEVGDEIVDYLKNHQKHRFSREEAIEIKKYFMDLCRENK